MWRTATSLVARAAFANQSLLEDAMWSFVRRCLGNSACSVSRGSRGQQRSARRRAYQARLQLEALEHRITPSWTVSDTGTAVVFTGDNSDGSLVLSTSGNL